MNICEHLAATAKLFPDKCAVVFEGQELSYRQLDQWSIQAGERLIAAGVRRGDRVALMLSNVPAFIVWYFAAARIGAISVSISTRSTSQEVAFLLGDCEARAFVVSDETAVGDVTVEKPIPKFHVSELGDCCDGTSFVQQTEESNWHDAAPNDAAVILYTSGTTGFPKGATLSHMNVRSNVNAFNHLCQMKSDDRVLLTVPLFHCFGQNAILNSVLNAGGTIVLQRKFDLSESKQLIAECQVTQLYGVPMMFQLFLDRLQPDDVKSVKYCFSAAAKLPLQISERWQEKFGMPIHEGYGLTETSPFASYNHRLQYVPGSIGVPIDAVEMKIVDTETGQLCQPGQLGEIAIRGPNVMLGYWNRPEDTALAIREGWFHSGDIGRTDEQGYFYIVDRVKDMITVGGLKVYPAEVERVLLEHDSVGQVAVVGVSDAVFGEAVVAFVVPADGCNEGHWLNELKEYARSELAHYKVPRQIELIDELPRNPSGKVLKTKLREYPLTESSSDTEQPRAADESNTPTVPDATPSLRDQLEQTHAVGRRRVVLGYLLEVVQSLTGTDEPPDPEARFLDAGLDSLMIVELSERVQKEIGPDREVPPTLVFDYPRIDDLADYLVDAFAPSEPDADSSAPRFDTEAKQPATTSPQLHQQIASMSEDEALKQLMRELESN